MIIVKTDKKGLDAAVKCLKAGKTVAYPTDTAYGLGADAANAVAVRKIFQIKGRDFRKPVHVVVGGIQQAETIVGFDDRAKLIFGKFLPGALTIILPLKNRKRSFRLLAAGGKTLGIRIPAYGVVQKISKNFDRPFTTTSANVSGQATAYSAQEVFVQFRNRKFQPDLILDGGKLKNARPSTVLDLSGKDVKILREGAVTKKSIIKAIERCQK